MVTLRGRRGAAALILPDQQPFPTFHAGFRLELPQLGDNAALARLFFNCNFGTTGITLRNLFPAAASALMGGAPTGAAPPSYDVTDLGQHLAFGLAAAGKVLRYMLPGSHAIVGSNRLLEAAARVAQVQETIPGGAKDFELWLLTELEFDTAMEAFAGAVAMLPAGAAHYPVIALDETMKVLEIGCRKAYTDHTAEAARARRNTGGPSGPASGGGAAPSSLTYESGSKRQRLGAQAAAAAASGGTGGTGGGGNGYATSARPGGYTRLPPELQNHAKEFLVCLAFANDDHCPKRYSGCRYKHWTFNELQQDAAAAARDKQDRRRRELERRREREDRTATARATGSGSSKRRSGATAAARAARQVRAAAARAAP